MVSLSSLIPIPASPILLPSDGLWALHLLSHLPVLTLAYLLFSPASSSSSHHRLLRASITPFAVWFCIFNSYLWRSPHPVSRESQKGCVITGTVWAMRAVEMGFRQKPPQWVGWEEGETEDERDQRRHRKNDVSTFGKRLKLAAYYCYSYRSVGWDTGAARSKSRMGMGRAPTSRMDLLLSFQLPRLVWTYLVMDLAVGLWTLHPFFGRIATAHQGSIYTPLHLVPFWPQYLAPWWVSSSAVALLLGFNLYQAQAFTGALISTVWSLVCEDPKEFALHDAAFYDFPWLSTSFRDLWTFRWHKMYRAKMLFCSYTPAAYLLRPFGLSAFGGMVATFVLSGAFHAVGYYDPFSDDLELSKEHAKLFFLFFILSAVCLFVEALFLPSTKEKKQITRPWYSPKRLVRIIGVMSTMVALGTPLADVWLRTGGAAGLGGEPGVQPVAGGAGGRWAARKLVEVLGGK